MIDIDKQPVVLTTVIVNKIKKNVYKIPGFSKYGICEDGSLYSLKVNRFRIWQYSKPSKANEKNTTHGYRVINIINDNDKYVGVSRHRLMMMVFKPVINMHNLYVNHINGIPGDDTFDNLEWITPRDNLVHALENGLMPNSVVKIDMLYMKTKELKTFNSIQSTANHLGWTHSKVTHRLTDNYGKVYPDMLVFKKHNDIWPKFNTTITTMGSRRKIISVNTLTNEIKEHKTIMDASSYTSVNTTSISQRAKSNNGKPSKHIKFYFKENYNKLSL